MLEHRKKSLMTNLDEFYVPDEVYENMNSIKKESHDEAEWNQNENHSKAYPEMRKLWINIMMIQ